MTIDELKAKLEGRTIAKLVYDRKTNEVLGLWKEWREANPHESVGMQSSFGCFYIGNKTIPYYKYEKDIHVLLGLVELHEAMLKLYEKKEKEHYAKAEPIAKAKLDKAESGLKKLLEDCGCSIDYVMNGDTYGIYEDYMYLSTEVDGVCFERRIEDK